MDRARLNRLDLMIGEKLIVRIKANGLAYHFCIFLVVTSKYSHCVTF